MRNVIGVIAALVVSFMAAGIHSSAFSPFGRLVDLFYAVAMTAIAVLATMVFIVLTTSAGSRGAVLRRLVVPLRTILLYPVAFAAPFVVGIVGYRLIIWTFRGIYGSGHQIVAVLVGLVLGLITVSALLSSAMYALLGAFVCVTTMFRAAEGHPLLAPIAAIAVVWVFPQLLRILGDAEPPGDLLGISVFYGGAVTVTLLSGLEIVRAARIPGLDLRGAPPATPLPRVRGAGHFRLPALTVVVSLAGAVAVSVAFGALVVSATPEPTGAPVLNTFHFPDGVGRVKLSRLSPDGRLLAASPEGNRTYLFDTHTAKIVETLPLPVEYPTAMAFSPDGHQLAVAGIESSNSRIHLWDVAAHKLVATLPLPAGAPGTTSRFASSLAFSSDGARLAANVAGTFSVLLWDTATGASAGTFNAPGKQKEVAYSSGVAAIAYLPGNTTMAVRTNEGVLFVNAANGAAAPLSGTAVDRVPGAFRTSAVSADGSTLAVSTGSIVADDARVSIWDLRTGTAKLTIEVPGAAKASQVDSLTLNDDGSLVAVGDSSGHVYLWATATGHLAGTLDTQSGWSIGGRPKDIVYLDALRGSSVLLDWDEISNVVLWDLSDIPGAGAWNKTTK